MGLGFLWRVQDVKPTAQRWRHLVEPPQPQPTRRFDDTDKPEPKIDDREILRHAKILCARDGAMWDTSELVGAERWERSKIVVDDIGRRKYIALAREELFKDLAL